MFESMTLRHSVLIHLEKGIASITLNRPQALNALTLEMTEAITDVLLKWQDDQDVRIVVVQGSGRAFCAGGDLRQIYQAFQKKGKSNPSSFFRHEYNLNRIIHHYPKPYIAILDGITMGGGMGLSIHGSHRIVTGNSLLAMPETKIGFFPDVGASHFLGTCPGSIGLYLGLTGNTIGPADALYCGLATHYLSPERLSLLHKNLPQLNSSGAISDFLDQNSKPKPQAGFLPSQRDVIEACFNQPTLPQIIKALESHPGPFAKQTLSDLKACSPLSLKVTFQLLKEAQELGFDTALDKELALSLKMVKARDFREGIRAAVIDKDRRPQWMNIP